MTTNFIQAQSILQAMIEKRAAINDAVFAHWIDEAECFWYRRDTLIDEKFLPDGTSPLKPDGCDNNNTGAQFYSPPVGKEYRLVNALAKTNQPAFNHERLAAALAKASEKNVDSKNLPVASLSIQLSPQALATQVRFTAFEKSWLYDIQTELCCHVERPVSQVPESNGLLSPDGRKVAFVRDYNLWVRDLTNDKARPLTVDGCSDYYYADSRFPGGVVQALWSPDSRYLFTHQLDRRQVAATPIVEHAPKDGGIRPQLHYQKVSLPGDKHTESYRFIVVNVSSGDIHDIEYPPISLCRSYGICYFSDEKLGWWHGGRRVCFVDVDLDAQTAKVLTFDVETGKTRVLFEESNTSFIKLRPVPERPLIIPLTATDELIWLSERSGFLHLYLYDLNSGQLKLAITEGEWNVKDVLYVDAPRRRLLLQTTHRHAEHPFYQDICWVEMDTGVIVSVAVDNCEFSAHNAQSSAVRQRCFRGLDDGDVSAVSPSGQFLVITRSRVDQLPESQLIDQNGKLVLTLETTEPVGMPENWPLPEPISLTTADGASTFYAVVYRPPGFSPEKQYPVLDFSCAHPAFACIPRASFVSAPYSGRTYLEAAAYAALGFIVVSMDGPAEPYRRKQLENSGHKLLAPIYGFADRKAGIEQLADRFPYLDQNRVGVVSGEACSDPVYGLLEYPDFYKAGVVSEYEDLRLMPASWEVLFKGFRECYADEYVDRLKGKLLLIHGMLDSEPPIASTLRLVDALQQCNKDTELMLLPNLGHEMSSYTRQRIWDFLVKHVAGEKVLPSSFTKRRSLDSNWASNEVPLA